MGSDQHKHVMYAQVLACDATLGYEDLYNVQLKKFNGTPVVNLRHLISLVNESEQPYMRFDLEYDVRCGFQTMNG